MELYLLYIAVACVVQTTHACNAFKASRESRPVEKLQDNRYILIWGGPPQYPMYIVREGIIKPQCAYTNCTVTTNMKLLTEVTEFDAILFNSNGKSLSSIVPKKRSAKQIYVYVNSESSHYYPVCDSIYNDFFNWTWTYKLDSDLKREYLKVYDLNGTEVGPRIDMHWSELGAVDNETKIRLRSKTVAGAWFVSNCRDKSGRLEFVHTTRKELKKYGHTIHIYGECGARSCPTTKGDECNRIIAKDYFFYFAFENSFAEDYVTEKVLTALNNYAVPVVFGAANYSRFLPPHSYLDARALGPAALAARIAALIADYRLGHTDAYYDFFRWRSRYSIKFHTPDYMCQICSALHNPEITSKQTVYKNFAKWWNSKHATCNDPPALSRLLNAIGKELRRAKYYLLDWLDFFTP